ncbi:hypothetical protein AB0M19_30430 [Streptomyces sp. NPDC051920]|uniref:hypothetical protein n=1 Tax=Streptomyces sp. NPDC051920 TaxID=3155523 RepID=UPI003425CB3B
MGTKTVDETGAETGTEAERDEQTVDVTEAGAAAASTDEGTGPAAGAEARDEADQDTDEQDEQADDADEVLAAEDSEADRDGGVGQGAAAVVSTALGLVSLTGSWVATVAAARETLVGQLRTSSTASVATQVKEVYGDAWATTALVGGLFALAALIIGVFVLVRPAFGAPGRPQAAWIKSVAWAGVSLGVVGLVLAVAKYSDVLLGLPSTS